MVRVKVHRSCRARRERAERNCIVTQRVNWEVDARYRGGEEGERNYGIGWDCVYGQRTGLKRSYEKSTLCDSYH